jgi:glycosyltransferase involved in cell wall biosynthesis
VLLIAGKDVGEKKQLVEIIDQNKLEDKVFFVGEVSGEDKITFLANADLFVLPSITENFGNVYIESLAAGTPIVASTGTPWSKVEYADCGKWVNNSVDDTSLAMLEMLKKDRETMKENSRKFAKEYDWKNIAIQFKGVFEVMLTK